VPSAAGARGWRGERAAADKGSGRELAGGRQVVAPVAGRTAWLPEVGRRAAHRLPVACSYCQSAVMPGEDHRSRRVAVRLSPTPRVTFVEPKLLPLFLAFRPAAAAPSLLAGSMPLAEFAARLCGRLPPLVYHSAPREFYYLQTPLWPALLPDVDLAGPPFSCVEQPGARRGPAVAGRRQRGGPAKQQRPPLYRQAPVRQVARLSTCEPPPSFTFWCRASRCATLFAFRQRPYSCLPTVSGPAWQRAVRCEWNSVAVGAGMQASTAQKAWS